MKTNQKHTLHRFGALLLALAMTFALAGCGSKTFDASGYVDASLKQVTTGDTKGLEAYKGQAVVTTAEDYDKELQDMIESITGSMELSESNLNLVKDLVKELLGNASYQVGEATEQDDGSFEVPLTIHPTGSHSSDASSARCGRWGSSPTLLSSLWPSPEGGGERPTRRREEKTVWNSRQNWQGERTKCSASSLSS